MSQTNTPPIARRFKVADVEVRLVPHAKGMRSVCAACGGDCEHTRKVSAWITLENCIADNKTTDELQDRVVAILKHDYRDSLQAAFTAAGVIETTGNDAQEAKLAKLIDLGAARVAGLAANPAAEAPNLSERLAQVIDELRAATADHMIVSDLAIDGPVICDTRRIEQLLANLISHAVTHAPASGTVIVRAWRTDRELMISVANSEQLDSEEPREVMRSGHQPASRLDICSEIARDHHGKLTVASKGADTRITFRMPLAPGSENGPKARLLRFIRRVRRH